MIDSDDTKKGGFAASAALHRQRQAAREVEAWDAALAAARAEAAPEPAAEPQADGEPPVPQPLPAEKTNGRRPPLKLDSSE